MAHLAHDPNARPDGKTTMELGAVLPATAEVKNGHLWVGGLDMVELAAKEGTALYVMDKAHLKQQLRAYKEALGANNIVALAGKAFLNKAMVRLLIEEDCYLDVSGGGELAIALAAGMNPAHIIVHGNNKTPRELTEALDAGVGLIVADCTEELNRINEFACERNKVQPILLRIKPGVVADTHEFIRTGAEDSKFGFGIADGTAEGAVVLTKELPGLELQGIHVHIGSQIFDISSYEETVEVLANFALKLHETHEIELKVLDMGGGLGIAYQSTDEPSTIKELGTLLVHEVSAKAQKNGLTLPRIIVEPGRSIVANAGLTLYTVGSIKDLKDVRCYVAIDGGMTDNIRPALYDAKYEAVVANKADKPRDAIVTLAGKHCESGDVIAIDASIQMPEPGDTVAVFGTGAYNATMSSNYNGQLRPAMVFVEDGVATLVQRRETYEDLMRRDV